MGRKNNWLQGGVMVQCGAPAQQWSRLTTLRESNEAEKREPQLQNKSGNTNKEVKYFEGI
ncbi:MAG: hypothetical protein FWG42_09030 [Clostridiales bacterium]|nr:hypothetical protein [Clostridiales bacterium]